MTLPKAARRRIKRNVMHTVAPFVARSVAALLGDDCPCCGTRMQTKTDGANMRTKAHVRPKALRRAAGSRHTYFFACVRCNNDQAGMTLEEWGVVLGMRDDARARRVATLAEYITLLEGAT